MTAISDYGRIVADQVISSAASFGDGLAQSIANNKSGHWAPGPLWDEAILSMRTQGGGLAQNLEHLKDFGPEILEALSPGLRAQLDEQLRAAKAITDEMHTDKGGEFAHALLGFQTYGDQVAAEIKELIAKADAANASAARISIEGSKNVGWKIGDAATNTVKVTEEAGTNTATMAAGGAH